ncbi:anti-sigma factor [Actinomycetospora cinnamomea]|uniref:Anti-sigma-K factor rskA n=1 Tax=Actinomycetospora cinnamomea TaxID=663609 RepID=A0A2U1F4I3_9PSEU|nr:anti-sigma factor [Actinomycetospora cinnamomea]PVZ06940.1 anti-sigma-K factor rskA [Actinomycetospora cinnamomea]
MSHPTADQLTDAALPGTPTDPDVAAHLGDCASCAAEVAALRRTVGHARDGVGLDVAPPPRPEVWDGILARLGDDAPGTPAPPPAARPGAATGTRVPRRSGRRLLAAGLAGLVAVAAVLAAVVLAGTPDSSPATTRVTLVAARPGVAGEVVGGGQTMHVEVTLPEPVPAGADLEVWDMGGGTPRSLGALQPVDGRAHWVGDLTLPGEGPMPPLDVSLEPPGSGPGHSGLSLAHTP